jgi:hypothetical protein
MNVATFNQADVNRAVVDFIPAQIVLNGKTVTERRVNLVQGASEAAKLFFANQKGKMGQAARAGLQETGMAKIAHHTRRGDYKPLAEALAGISGEAVFITNRASYESLNDRYDAKLEELKASGKLYKKDGETMSPKAAAAMQCLMLLQFVRDGVEAIIAQEQNEGE